MTTTTTTQIRAFLALPGEALPAADYVGEPGILHPWSALRVAIGRDADMRDLLSGAIRLHADRDGWRDGVVVTLS